MRILIVGAGEVGFHLAGHLATESQDVVVIDRDARALARVAEAHDVQTVLGSGSCPSTLREAGIDSAEMLIAVTDSDEVNLVACLMASRLASKETTRIARIREVGLAHEVEAMGPELGGVHRAINPERLAAEKILALLRLPGTCDHFEFEDGAIQVVGMRVEAQSPLLGRSIMELAQAAPPGERLLYGAVFRQGQVIIPRGDTRLEEGDVVYPVVPRGGLDSLLSGPGDHAPARSVVVGGGSAIALHVASSLVAEGVACKLIAPDESFCERCAADLEDLVVLRGEPTDRSLLAEEFVGEVDAFVAAGPDDEENILAALLARQLGARRTFVVTRKAAYIPLLRVVGVDVAVAPRLVAVSSILTYLRHGRVLQVASLGEAAEALEFEVPAGSPITAAPLGRAHFPSNALVVAVAREGRILVPSGQDWLQPGDRVVVFALRSAIGAVEKALSARRRFRFF